MKKIEKNIEKGKIIDFRSIEVEDLAGVVQKFDISKGFGNYLYKVTGDIGMFEIARNIYNEGEVELTDSIAKELINLINDPNCPFIAILKVKLIEMIKGHL